MLLRSLLALTMLLASAIGMGADSTDSSSPFDKNPACMDRTTDASTGNCVIKDEGTPRHTYPPKTPPSGGTPGPAPLPAGTSSTVRKSGAGGK
jgi:hypothetical protein